MTTRSQRRPGPMPGYDLAGWRDGPPGVVRAVMGWLAQM